MSLAINRSFSIFNPHCNFNSARAPMASHLFTPRAFRISVAHNRLSPVGPGRAFFHLNPTTRSSWTTSVTHEESKHSEIEVEDENDGSKSGAEESEEAWQQTLNYFKEQALKMQSISQEAYETYSRKAMIVLKETSKELKIQADKARHDLSVIANEISKDGKEYLSTAAQNYPEPVKEIVKTFSTTSGDLNEISKVHDFYLGIPYGLLLSVGGFLSFMLTGSISAIRFGVILGGTLLALSISSFKSHKSGESISIALKGQGAIAGILFLRELRLLSQRSTVLSFCTTLISGAMVAFYLYRMTLNWEQDSNFDQRTEN